LRLRTKTSAVIVISVICLLVLAEFTIDINIDSEINNNEAREGKNLLERINANIGNDVNSVNLTCYSWACWDETYDYVQGHNSSYIDRNFDVTYVAGYDLNIIIFLNQTGTMIHNINYNTTSQSLEDIDSRTLSLLVDDPYLRDHPDSLSISGVMALPSGPCMVSAWDVTTSDQSGPRMGTLIFGRYIDQEKQAILSSECGTSVVIGNLNGTSASSEQTSAK
jgi:sensor domain CHASE-containing protein